VRAGDAPEVTTDDMEIVSALRCALADKVGNERFELWFGANTRLEFADGTLLIGVPNRFFLDWIRSNFRRQIESACLEVMGRCPAVKFHVDAPLSQPNGTSDHAVGSDGVPRGGDAARSDPAARATSAEELPSATRKKEPSLGVSPRRKFASLQSFLPGLSHRNRVALASAEMVARCPGEMTPLLIHGPTSVGKTHLLEGIWVAARKSNRGTTVLYLSAEQFTTQFLEALRGSGLPSFRRKYRGLGVLILDDLQFMAGKRATQVELLHTVDTLLRERRQVVFAASRSPAELTELGPELATRLQSGMVCPIDPPDHTARLGIVGQLAARRKLRVPREVQAYIASHLTNHARELSGAICRLQATSEALGRPITPAMAEEALAEMIRNSGRVVRLSDIEKAVCSAFGLESGTLHSGGKSKRVSHPRMLAMWLARKHTRAALSEIGQYFGRRSHSTVISAQKRVDNWMAAGEPLQLADRTWNVDEAIRQVERHLMAG